MRVLNLIELGAALRAARLRSSLGQEQLAIKVGATQEWISRLENGRLPNPGLSTVMQLMTVLDLDLCFEGPALSSSSSPDVLDMDGSELASDEPAFLKR
jgi:transcriptional regulator with XRE-family HTH domain